MTEAGEMLDSGPCAIRLVDGDRPEVEVEISDICGDHRRNPVGKTAQSFQQVKSANDRTHGVDVGGLKLRDPTLHLLAVGRAVQGERADVIPRRSRGGLEGQERASRSVLTGSLHDHPDRHRPTRCQRSGHRTRPIFELLDNREHLPPRRFTDVRVAVQDAGDRHV